MQKIPTATATNVRTTTRSYPPPGTAAVALIELEPARRDARVLRNSNKHGVGPGYGGRRADLTAVAVEAQITIMEPAYLPHARERHAAE